MNKLEKAVLVVKQVRYKTIEISEANGYIIPTSARDMAEMAVDLRDNYMDYANESDVDWVESGEETILQSVEYVEENNQ